ncbi:hypothetical protein [Clostridium paridis]|uniref:Uncharacterized protein n=1 Tax=Clostridium paridis TaxID=2803863 RepID=A0A937K609_9CLOT|nr:hypothetical protein [Clostridium paridis]MBL4933193.1 hypothetical protein [Clostridium paridis]
MNNDETERINKYIVSVRWQNAKSYEKTAPHEYTIRQWKPDLEEEFIWFVNYIRANGVKEWFYKKQNIYFYYKGLKYWTMGDAMENTWVINRTDDMKAYR